MHRITKTLVLVFSFLILTLSGVLAYLPATQAAATPITGGDGTVGNVNSGENTRFKFVSPFDITDTATGKNYHTSATACGSDNMMFCSKDDDTGFIAGAYWYWPDGKALQTVNGNQCTSALVLTMRHHSSTLDFNGIYAMDNSNLYLVNPKYSAISGGSGCYVSDADGNNVSQQNMEGWGAAPESESDNIGAGQNGGAHADGTVNSSFTTKISKEAYSDRGMFQSLATFFYWVNDSQINSFIGNAQLTKVQQGDDSWKQIQGKLSDQYDSSRFKNGYDYYYPSACVQNNNIMAFLAVQQGNPAVTYVVHRQDGDGTKDFRASEWNGDQQRCLFGNNNIKSNPSSMYDGSDDGVLLGVANVNNYATKPSTPTSGGGIGSTGTNDAASCTDTDSEGNCASSTGCDFDGNPLTWIICPLVGAAEQFINRVDTFITSTLDFNTESVFGADNGYYTAWNSFRIIATALLIIGGLVMVSSQAFGFEFLDAYTIRKVLPRLIVAIIGISLSWPLMEFVITFFNTLGIDIRNLMYAPFDALKQSQGGTLGGSVLAVGNGALLAAIIALGVGGALSLLVTAALAILVGFFIIIVRDLALTVIIILAPVAIACYVLPNTQKVWKLWSVILIGLLLVFPIISAFIAAGRIFSAVSLGPQAGNGTLGGGTASQIVGFIAYFLPYFLLPIAFRLATGVVGTIAGFVNDRGRGAFDRLKKYRGGQIAKNTHALQTGERFNNRALNAASSRLTTRNAGFGARGRAAYNQKMDLAAMEHAKSAAGQAAQHNDGVLRAQTYGSAFEARANMGRDFGMSNADVEEAIAGVKANGGFGRNRQVFAAQQLSATGTGYDNIQQVAQTIARASHGNTSQIASLAGNINSSTKQVGRGDLAPGFGALNTLAQGEAGVGAAPTAGNYHTATRQAWNSIDPSSVVRGKGKQIEQFTTHFRNIMADPGASAVHKRDAAIALSEMQAALPGASGESQRFINDALQQVGIDHNAPASVEEQLSGILRAQGITMTSQEIDGLARKYGGNVPRASLGGTVTPPPTSGGGA